MPDEHPETAPNLMSKLQPTPINTLYQQTDSRERSDRIFRTIRERICLLEYPPGSSLRERDLAEEFEVSRTPIRTVLQRLEFGGLTYSRQGHGTIVTEVEYSLIREIYLVRMKLAEMFGVSASLENVDEVHSDFHGLIAACETIAGKQDLIRFARINIGLHTALQKLISNQVLKNQLDILFYQTVRLWFYILSSIDWSYEIEEIKREILELKHFLSAGDLESMGYVRRNSLSLVLRQLDSITGNNRS